MEPENNNGANMGANTKKGSNGNKTTPNTDDIIIPTDVVENTEGGEDTTPATTPVAISVPASMTYQQALTVYKDRRIQFDKVCQAIPNNVTFKNNTTVMLDNRADLTRTLNIGGTVSIKPFGFKLLKLSSSTLPKTILVDCGNGQNVATILLQK